MEGKKGRANRGEVYGRDVVRSGRRNDASAPYSNGGSGLVLALAMVAFLFLGILWAIIDLNPFWIVVAVWALVIAFLPAWEHRDIRFITAWWLLALIALPFIVETVGIAVGLHPLDITSSFAWIVEGISLFALSMITIIFIDVREGMNMERLFLTITSFLFFEAVLVVQGWMSWYSDLGLGTDLVPTNDDFMIFFILCTVVGLVLALSVSIILRARPYGEVRERLAGRRPA